MQKLLAAVLLAASTSVCAVYPDKPIKVLIGYAPGGSTDVVARLLAPKLSEKLGQPIIIENKPGGAGDFAAEMMLQAPADGYTLMMTTVAVHAINPGLMKQKFDPINDFTPLAFVCSYPMIMIASPQTTFKTLGELKAFNAATPAFYSSSGVGSPGHLSGELLRSRTGLNMTHVPYKGGLALDDGHHVGRGAAQLRHAPRGGAADPRRQGARRGARVETSATPRCPTCRPWPNGVSASFEVGTWSALIGPKGVPAEVVQKVHAAVAACSPIPRCASASSMTAPKSPAMTSAELGTFMRTEKRALGEGGEGRRHPAAIIGDRPYLCLCENNAAPAAGRSASRIEPLSDSVITSFDVPGRYATLVTVEPAGLLMKCVTSPRALR
jgi:tripartite-type tricarboxylate transporter receptor subunit TctC